VHVVSDVDSADAQWDSVQLPHAVVAGVGFLHPPLEPASPVLPASGGVHAAAHMLDWHVSSGPMVDVQLVGAAETQVWMQVASLQSHAA
jgi:hypothetical protein